MTSFTRFVPSYCWLILMSQPRHAKLTSPLAVLGGERYVTRYDLYTLLDLVQLSHHHSIHSFIMSETAKTFASDFVTHAQADLKSKIVFLSLKNYPRQHYPCLRREALEKNQKNRNPPRSPPSLCPTNTILQEVSVC